MSGRKEQRPNKDFTGRLTLIVFGDFHCEHTLCSLEFFLTKCKLVINTTFRVVVIHLSTSLHLHVWSTRDHLRIRVVEIRAFFTRIP